MSTSDGTQYGFSLKHLSRADSTFSVTAPGGCPRVGHTRRNKEITRHELLGNTRYQPGTVRCKLTIVRKKVRCNCWIIRSFIVSVWTHSSIGNYSMGTGIETQGALSTTATTSGAGAQRKS